MCAWPDDRPDGYDSDKGYDEGNEDWTSDDDHIIASGGRYKEVLIAIAYGTIYFGDF